ncbi:MAG: diacylglycerol kinase family lipid kinase [Anaerolineaceae bacterium]|nr:diacylglycerol kinase family lipid kinase [Anaerolineaceae bacterium]
MKAYIIVNPISGRGHGEQAIPQMEALLSSYNLEYELVRTEKPWHAADLAEAAARSGFDVVATASGDGTANEAVNGLMRARAAGFNKTAFSILPVGTGNDMNFGLGNHLTMEDGIRALAEDYRRKIDIGIVHGGDYPEGRYFANCIGIGFDAVVGFEAAKIRWASGLPVYLMAVLKTVFLYFHAPKLEITLDGESFTQRSLMTSIMNGRRLGGGFMTAPEGDPGDGWFDLCIVSEATRLRLFQLIPLFLKGTQATQPEIKMKRAKKVKVVALDGTLPVHADGETLCYEGKGLELELIPGALDFITIQRS